MAGGFVSSRESDPLVEKMAPPDLWNLVYLSFVLMGAGFLFPWNAVITAVDFWALIYFPDIIFYMTVAYMAPNLIGLIFVVAWGQKIPMGVRLVFGFLEFIGILIALAVVRNWYISLALVAALGFGDAIVQGSVYGFAGQFTPMYVGAVMSGNGFAGSVISILRILTKISLPDSVEGQTQSAVVYFAISCFFLFLCIVTYMAVLRRSPVTAFYLARSKEALSENLNSDNAAFPNKAIADSEHLGPSSSSALKIFKQLWLPAVMVGWNFFCYFGFVSRSCFFNDK